jgi:hypothetical protein
LIERDGYYFYGHSDEPPPGACARLADARQLRKNRPRWASSLAAEQCVTAGEERAWAILRASKGRWAAAHASPQGVAVGPWEREYPDSGERMPTLFASSNDELPQALFDYDGDGVPEFLHGRRLTDPGGGGVTVIDGELWSYRGGRVVRYPGVPTGIRLARDLDGDGRPDLLFTPFRGKLSYGMCYQVFDASSQEVDALFAAHSLPDGTFSSTDQVAIDHAKTWCPEPPDLAATGDAAYQGIPCARAWGIEARKLAPLIIAHCEKEIGRCPSQQCVDQSVLQKWTQLRAPLQLSR